MSKRRKKVSKKATPQAEKVPFKAFFARCVNTGLLKPWAESEIHSYFRGLGLSDKEDQDVYMQALKKY